MAKAEQEAHWGISLQTPRKALRPWHRHPEEKKALPDRQRGLSIHIQHNTLDLGSIRDRVKKKRAFTLVKVANSSLQPRPTDAEWQPLKPFEPSAHALVSGDVSANTRVHEPQKQTFYSLTFPLCCFDQISCWLSKDSP